MDNNPENDGQHMDNEDNYMEECLRNPVVLRRILEHFSSPELLRLSSVNKLWKYEARSVVRQRGNLIANLKYNGRPGNRCETVAAFVSDLPKVSHIPISGIKFDNDYHDYRHVCSHTREARVAIQAANLHDQLSLKNVSVNMRGPWLRPQFRNCPAILLAKKVLQQFCEDLEEVELNISVGQADCINQVMRDCYFPRLKVLKVSCHALNEDIENYMRALLSRTPNLKTLHTNWNINSVLHLLKGTSVEFVYTSSIRAPFDEVTNNVISSTRFQWMDLEYTGPGFNFERFNRIAPHLLQVPRTTTIRYMHLDAIFAVPLMCYGTRLPNIKVLWLDIGRLELIEQRILAIVRNFDFTRIFPNLNKVYVMSNNQYVHGFPAEPVTAYIERANAVLTEPLLDRAARIKQLFLAHWHPCDVAAQFFVHMFPSIEKLEITKGAAGPIPFGSIWNWLDLNELEVKGNILPTTGNLDSVFCGIFPEEVEELRLKDDEYLKQVNIVPVMPALTCLRKLRTISFHHHHSPNNSFGDATFMFSKVTALLAFAKFRTLVVNLKISARATPPAMTHLEPYVSFKSDLLEDEY